MLFEIRSSVPDVSEPWIEARNLFLKGNVREAWDKAYALRGQSLLKSANDYLLNIEIARACSAHKTYLALARRAVKKFPNDPIVMLYHARVLLTRSRHTEGIQYLLDCESTLGKTDRAIWGTELANMYASAGFESSCNRWIESLKDEPEMDSPLALYSQSCAHLGLQRWDEAIHYAQLTLQKAPNWSRVRGYLVNCLLAREQIDAARNEIAEATQRGHQEAIIDFTAAMLPMSLGDFDLARDRLKGLLRDWPHSDFIKWAQRTLCIIHVELGEYDLARDVAGGKDKELALPPIPEKPNGGHHFISLPLIAQNRNQCVPTSVAMTIYPQGKKFDPDVMFQEMHGREGTQLWRTRKWCESNGFQVVPIRLDKDAVIALLKKDIPLMGILEGPFSSHVDVVCGYNEDLDTFYIRDPSNWVPIAYPTEIALSRYELHNGLLAIIDSNNTSAIQLAQQSASNDLSALLDLSEATATGQLMQAEEAYKKIADTSPSATIRDFDALHVAISPLKFSERMKEVSIDENANLISRFRAIMALGPGEYEEVLESLLSHDESEQFGRGPRQYLELLKSMTNGDWQTALKLINRQLVRGCSVAHFWDVKSDILAELGDQQQSDEMLDRAIELEPLRISFREKALRRATHHLSLEDYTSKLTQLTEEDPDDKRLLVSQASLLLDGPDGKRFEQAALEAKRWFPRMPACYSNLLQWYQHQGRNDLYQTILEEAKHLLPEIYESDDEHTTTQDKDKKEEVELELPTEKEELLDLVWKLDDPRREEAIKKVRELEASQKLHWHESARFLACRLLLSDSKEGEPNSPESILPSSPPGSKHWYADALCDILTDFDLDISTALAVDNWLVKLVTNIPEYSELWFKRILILENAHKSEEALDQLEKLLDRYPATSSALYRMGVVKFRQQDYQSCQEYFEKALKVNSGLLGALEMLKDTHFILGEKQKALSCIQLLRKKLPYAVYHLRDEVKLVAELSSDNQAIQLLDQSAFDFQEDRIDFLRASLYLSMNNIKQAESTLSKYNLAETEDEDAFEELLQTQLHLATLNQDSKKQITLCDQGLARWPDSTRLKEVKAENLLETNPEESLALLREVFYEDKPETDTLWQYLGIPDTPPVTTIKDLISGAPDDRKQDIAELYAEISNDSRLVQWNEGFLEWALVEFPESDSIRWWLVLHFDITTQPDRAVPLAKELLKRNPNAPEATRILGRCLIDQDSKKALQYLEEACSINRDSDSLFDLARCHGVSGNESKSIDIHWEILEHNPFYTSSWTNLYLSGSSQQKLWSYLENMLKQECGIHDEYFHVAAFKLALDLNSTLPQSWVHSAAKRWDILQTYPGYRDEKTILKKALLAWSSARPEEIHPDLDLQGNFIERITARYWWPGKKWIPKTYD
ncbi:MAG: hypothetical protein COA78_14450 [Blastopirellula sp.]|nr:MAG: hypothetical protein COA78_14450 [Blastopirellula sp.]